MGIKNLHKLFRKHISNIYTEIPLNTFKYKKIAVDISLYIYKYKTILGDRWISALLNLISILRKNDIHTIFVFDNKPTEDKKETQEKRKEHFKKLSDKITELEISIDKYEEEGIISDILIDVTNKNRDPKQLLFLGKNKNVDLRLVNNYLEKLKLQNVSLCTTDFDTIKELLDILNIPYLLAEDEAERYCCELVKSNLVYGVLSEDTDVLAYGCPYFLTKIDTKKEMIIVIDYNEILHDLNLTKEQFTDLCIMCGTDYNNNIRGIGPEKSFILIKKYLSIEEIDKNEKKYDCSVLKYERGRELFKLKDRSDVEIGYCGKPDFIKLQEFLFRNNINNNMDKLRNNFEKTTINITIEE